MFSQIYLIIFESNKFELKILKVIQLVQKEMLNDNEQLNLLTF